MAEDIGFETWLELKSRKCSNKYPTSHTYKKKEVSTVVGNTKNRYLKINNLNEKIKSAQISIVNKNNNKAYEVEIKQNCFISLNKRNNWLLENLLSDSKVSTKIEKNAQKCTNTPISIEFEDSSAQFLYKINYKLNDVNESKQESEESVDCKTNTKKKVEKANREKKSFKTISNKKQRLSQAEDVKQEDKLEQVYSYEIVMPAERFKHVKNIKPKAKTEEEDYSFWYDEVPTPKIKKGKVNSVGESKLGRRNTNFKLAVDDAIVTKRSLEDEKIEKVLEETKVLSIGPVLGSKSFADVEKVNKAFIKNLTEVGKLVKKTVMEKETTCEICYSTTNHMIEIDACCHRACLDCWETYVKSQIKDFKSRRGGDAGHITCLYNDCDSVLSLDFLASILPHHLVKKYIRFYCELKLIRSENYIPCPKDYCDHVILIDDNSNNNISICECNHAICNKCHNEAHFPISCDEATEYINQFDNDKTSQTSIPGKLCPRCRRFIEKNGGCNHMTCICGYEFCWICCSNYYKHTVCRVMTLKSFNTIYLDSPKMQEAYELASRSNGMLPKNILNQDVNKTIQSIRNKFIKSFKNLNINSFNALVSLDMVYKTLVQLSFNLNYLMSYCKYSAVKQVAKYNNQPNHANTQALNVLISTSRFCFRTQKLINDAKDLKDICTLLSANSRLKGKIEKLNECCK